MKNQLAVLVILLAVIVATTVALLTDHITGDNFMIVVVGVLGIAIPSPLHTPNAG